MSNIGLTAMSCILYTWATKPQVGWGLFLALYGIPYLVRSISFFLGSTRLTLSSEAL